MTTVTGPVAAVDEIIAARDELHRERLDSVARATVRGAFGSSERTHAQTLGLSFEPVSLQQLTVHLTTRGINNAGATATLVTWLDRWRQVVQWFADQSTLSIMAGWPTLLGLVLAGLGFVVIRRATP